MLVGSLFSGIGGLDLGLERAGMTVRWQVENDEYCARVLAKHWPDVARYGDIKELDPDDLEPVDLICGGFPCQPVSLAGKGLAQQDERWLWPEFARIVRHLRPRYVLVENVPGLLVHGMGDVLGDLAALGYDTEWQCVPASAVGAPHLRWRVFVVAYAVCSRRREDARGASRHEGPDAGWPAPNDHQPDRHGEGNRTRYVADADKFTRRSEARDGLRGLGETPVREWAAKPQRCGLNVADAQEERRSAFGPFSTGQAWSDDLPRHAGQLAGTATWPTEPDVGRVAHGVPARVDRLRALGNAVVPQVAEYVGRCIVAFDECREREAV